MVVGDVTTAVDVLVLGGGPGGYVAAIRAAQLGRHVTLIEPGPMGGVCLNRGCIPLKALVSATERYQQARSPELAAMGIHAETVSFDWHTMSAWKQGIVTRLSEGVRRLMAGNHIEVVTGTGWFINGQEVRVEGEHGSHRFKFDDCIIATGATNTPPSTHWYTAEQVLRMPELPPQLTIYGNDYIALELTTLLARLDVDVRLYSPDEQLLAGVDSSALRLLEVGLRKLGVKQKMIEGKTFAYDLSAMPPLVATGYALPNTQGLHLQDVGVQVGERGEIVVNTMQQTNVSHIYAVGDCTGGTGGQQLASVAIKQGKVAAEVLCGQRVQYAPLSVPLVVHTAPEIAAVGLSQEGARAQGYSVKTGRFPLAANGRALTLGADAGVALVVADAESEALLGATLVGPRAGDLIGQLALAIEMGATLTDLDEILYAHPGLSEMLQESIEDALGRAIHIVSKK
jgi:dihydrolipoamide dehydrogenase